jgi:hypothetical protein
MNGYTFGAGGFKLGERVEIRSSKLRGVLVAENVHMTGCNTYDVAVRTRPRGKFVYYRSGENMIQDIKRVDYMMLRRLADDETMLNGDLDLDEEPKLTDDDFFMPKGDDVNSEWIAGALDEGKEFIPEIDEAVGVEEITICPGNEVYDKILGRNHGIVMTIKREIYSKELSYHVVHYAGRYKKSDLEKLIKDYDIGKDGKLHEGLCHAYQLIVVGEGIAIKIDGKTGPDFEEHRDYLPSKRF